MCGIGGFSLAQGSKVNARALSNALLSEMEWRGTDASGYAWAKADGTEGIHKDAKTGSQLNLKGLPRDATTVILHTRLATHGHQSNNDNNHPVTSPDGSIRTTHNGVIWNHEDARGLFPEGVFLPEVDTSVIPAMLQFFGVDGFAMLAGDAASGWLDRKTTNTLHLAKMSHSPVSFAKLLDGSFVYASTEEILGRALTKMGLEFVGYYPTSFKTMKDGEYMTVLDGNVTWMDDVEWYDDYSRASFYTGFRKATSGNHTTVTTSLQNDDEDTPGGFNEYGVWRDSSGQPTAQQEADWDIEADREAEAVASRAMALYDYDGTPKQHDNFYVLDHEGDYEGYTTLQTLTTMLRWFKDVTPTGADLVAEGDERWVNHYRDVGEVMDDGSLSSWVGKPEDTYVYDDHVEGGLQFVRDGLGILRNVMA